MPAVSEHKAGNSVVVVQRTTIIAFVVVTHHVNHPFISKHSESTGHSRQQTIALEISRISEDYLIQV